MLGWYTHTLWRTTTIFSWPHCVYTACCVLFTQCVYTVRLALMVCLCNVSMDSLSSRRASWAPGHL